MWLQASFVVHAQSYDPPLRLEIDVAADKQPYRLQTVGKSGIILISQAENKDKTDILIQHLDTNFKEIAKKNIPLIKGISLSCIQSQGDLFFAVYQTHTAFKEDITNTYILSYNTLKKKLDIFSFCQPNANIIREIKWFGNGFAYIAYNEKNDVVFYLFDAKKMSVNELYENSPAIDFYTTFGDTLTHSLWIISSINKTKEDGYLSVTQIDSTGEKKSDRHLVINGDKILNSCILKRSDREHLLLFGNYTIDNKAVFSSPKIDGIYTMKFDEQSFSDVTFFSFSNLENEMFFPKKSSNIYINTYFLSQNDSLILFASDFYTPEYRQQTESDFTRTYTWSGMPYYSTSTKFIGYRYQTAVVFMCNQNGQILRTNFLNYNGLLLNTNYNLLQSYIDSEEGNILLFFVNDSKLYSLIYNRNQLVQPVKTDKIETTIRFQSVVGNRQNLSRHWYDNYFITFGYQRLADRYMSKKNVRNVFYINKLVYE
jgi:hypothetical protein